MAAPETAKVAVGAAPVVEHSLHKDVDDGIASNLIAEVQCKKMLPQGTGMLALLAG